MGKQIRERVMLGLQGPTQATAIYAANEQDLLAIAAQPNGAGYAMARSLIEQYGTQTFVDTIVFPSQGHSMLHNKPSSRGSEVLLEAHPNPANDRLEIITRLPKEENEATLTLFDSQGHEVRLSAVVPGVQIQEWNVLDYAPGIYRLTLSGGRGTLDGQSISIVR